MNKNRLLIIGFTLNQELSYSIASIMAHLKENNYNNFIYQNIDCNLSFNELKRFLIEEIIKKINIASMENIAFGTYIWSKNKINPIILVFRENGFKGNIILGGYEITIHKKKELEREYPDCQYFIDGYGEESLLSILNDKKHDLDNFISKKVNVDKLKSPYISNIMKIKKGESKVVLETKRGCPFKCSFCRHRDLTTNRVNELNLERVKNEIDLFVDKKVKKINIIDPVFNVGKNYISILEYLISKKYKGIISLQVRIDLIKSKRGEEFLKLCKQLNVILEIGIQTVHSVELEAINRRDITRKSVEIFKYLNVNSIKFEVSIIYGLPNQTSKSFKETIAFLKENRCKKIEAFPLLLLKGTELYDEQEKYRFKLENNGDYNIPHVVSSDSYSKKDYLEMKEISDSLKGDFYE